MQIYTLVVTYNGEKCITKCLQSLRDSTIQSKVLVIDNASTDSTVDLIRGQFPEVRLLSQTENLGFGAANNIGLRLALDEGAEYVFLLNQDAYVDEKCIEELILLSKLYDDYGIISPMQYYERGKLDHNFSLYLEDGISKYGVGEIIQPADFVNAAAWLIPLNVIKQVGGFSPLFYHYGEDVNFCDRVLFYKYKIGIAVNVNAYHEREQQISIQKRYFTYLLERFKLKSLIYLADPKYSISKSLKKLETEILAISVSGKIYGTLYRIAILKIIAIFISLNWRKIRRNKKQSFNTRAFLKT